MDFHEILAPYALWILWVALFLMVLILATREQPDNNLGALFVLGLYILTLVVGWTQDKVFDAFIGLSVSLFLAIVIATLIKIR